MGIIKKFVINRSDSGNFYVEKSNDLEGIKYLIYNKSDRTCHTPGSFYTIYGLDKKMSISNFINYAEKRIIDTGIYNEKTQETFKNLEAVRKKIIGKNFENPSLWGYRETFVTAIANYNELMSEFIDTMPEEDYEAQLELLKAKQIELERYVRVRKEKDVA